MTPPPIQPVLRPAVVLLVDFFAAYAMNAYLHQGEALASAAGQAGRSVEQHLAAYAYDAAEAMMAERRKRGIA